MSLRRRITAAAALAVAAVAVMLAVAGYISTRSELTSQIRQQLWQRSRSFVSGGGDHQASQATGVPSNESPGGGPSACAAPVLAGQRSSMTSAEARALGPWMSVTQPKTPRIIHSRHRGIGTRSPRSYGEGPSTRWGCVDAS